MPQEDQTTPKSSHPLHHWLLKGCVVVLLLVGVFAFSLFRIYGVDTHHKNRNGIWWPERGRSLIPPTATDIILRRDLLDHYATYTISEKDLNAFLDERFARNGKALDSHAERGRPKAEIIGTPIGPFGWIVTKETVVYQFDAPNGAVSSYHHDPTTGRTYQSSAYW